MSRRARVLFCVPDPEAGGAALHALELLRHLDREAFAPSLLVREPGQVPSTLAARCEAVRGARSTYEIAEALRALRPDVVQHYNNVAVPVGIEMSGVRPFSVQLLHANHALERGFARVPTDETDVLLAVSESAARLYPGPAEDRAKLRVLWNGVDTARWAPRAGAAPPGPLQLLCVARLDDAAKRVSEVIDAAARLERGTWALTVVGDGPDRARLEAGVASRGLSAAVRFAGGARDVRPFHARADVLVSAAPSEGFGLAIAEAAASGLAIAARRCHGITEAMDHGAHALLSGSAEELAAHLAALAAGPALRAALGGAARALVERRFDLRRMVAAYEALYREGMGAAATR